VRRNNFTCEEGLNPFESVKLVLSRSNILYVCVECVPYLFLIKGTLFDLGKKSRRMWERQREEEELGRKGDVGVGGVYI
jgi:hypothetical protein